MGFFIASNVGVSPALNILRTGAVASILIPLSVVETARRFPSLLNRKRGRV